MCIRDSDRPLRDFFCEGLPCCFHEVGLRDSETGGVDVEDLDLVPVHYPAARNAGSIHLEASSQTQFLDDMVWKLVSNLEDVGVGPTWEVVDGDFRALWDVSE